MHLPPELQTLVCRSMTKANWKLLGSSAKPSIRRPSRLSLTRYSSRLAIWILTLRISLLLVSALISRLLQPPSWSTNPWRKKCSSAMENWSPKWKDSYTGQRPSGVCFRSSLQSPNRKYRNQEKRRTYGKIMSHLERVAERSEDDTHRLRK